MVLSFWKMIHDLLIYGLKLSQNKKKLFFLPACWGAAQQELTNNNVATTLNTGLMVTFWFLKWEIRVSMIIHMIKLEIM